MISRFSGKEQNIERPIVACEFVRTSARLRQPNTETIEMLESGQWAVDEEVSLGFEGECGCWC